MAQLLNFSLRAPGAFGLNKQDEQGILPPEWATEAKNLVISNKGNLQVRKGWSLYADTSTIFTNEAVTAMLDTGPAHNNPALIYYVSGRGKFYARWDSNGFTFDYTGALTGLQDEMVLRNFNDGKVLAYDIGTAASQLVRLNITTTLFTAITASGDAIPTDAVDMFTGWGRTWLLSDEKLYWSALLDETNWKTTAGPFTDAGWLELGKVWEFGRDKAVALAEFNNNLVIFGERQVLIFAGPEDPTASTFIKVEALSNAGTVDRKTVQDIGGDLLWLSQAGFRTFSRVVQEKSMPFGDAAPQVKDYILSNYDQVSGATAARVSSTYNANLGLYVLTTAPKTFIIDTRIRLPNGSFRVTEWDGGFSSTVTDTRGELFFGHLDKVIKYSGSKDVNLALAVGHPLITVQNISIKPDYNSGWLDFSQLAPEVADRIKFLKHLSVSTTGGENGILVFKWATDYRGAFRTATKAILVGIVSPRFSVSRYSLNSYGVDTDVLENHVSTTQNGSAVKIGIGLVGGDTTLDLNQINIRFTLGKQAL